MSTATKITIRCSDAEFQKTLTERERQYIDKGSNWMYKLSRKCFIRDLHARGFTIDDLDEYEKRNASTTHE